jgi:hypothetical protein
MLETSYNPTSHMRAGDNEYLPGQEGDAPQEGPSSIMKVQYAQREHQSYSSIPITASLVQLGLWVSPSVRWYFTYEQVLTLKNMFMGALSAIFTVFYVRYLASLPGESYTSVLFTSSSAPFNWMSASRMPDYLVPYWYAIIVTNCTLSFLWTFICRWWITRKQEQGNANSTSYDQNVADHHLEERMGRGGSNLAIDVIEPVDVGKNILSLQSQQDATLPAPSVRYVGDGGNIAPSAPSISSTTVISDDDMTPPVAASFRRIDSLNIEAAGTRHVMDVHKDKMFITKFFGWSKSFALFAGLVAAQAVVNYYAYVNAPTLDSQVLLSFVISIGLLAFNVIWKKLSNYATTLELHTYLTTFLTSSFVKTQIFKLVTTVVVFNISQLRLFLPASEDVSGLPFPGNCIFENMTRLFAINICTDVVSVVMTTLVFPALYRMTARCRSRHSIKGDGDLRPEFSLPNQLSQLLYNEALVVLATPDFPLYPLFAGIWMFLRGYIDRVYLLRSCRPVIPTKNSNKNVMTPMNLISVLTMIIMPPNAVMWLVLSYSNQCQSYF